MKPPFSRFEILIVDDEPFSLTITEKLLRKMGIEYIRQAESGEQALEILGHDSATFDIIFLDIEMPGMSGFDLARRIRIGALPRYKDVPIVLLTGKDSEENVRRARTRKILGFVVKPPQMNTLKPFLDSIMAEHL